MSERLIHEFATQLIELADGFDSRDHRQNGMATEIQGECHRIREFVRAGFPDFAELGAENERLKEERDNFTQEVLEAQADLQTALGIVRLLRGEAEIKHGDHVEDSLARSLARLHRLLGSLGRPMHDPATHPEISGALLERGER